MTTPVSRYLPPMLLGLSVVLAVANWYLDPAHVRSWATALSVLACMSGALSFFRPSSSSRAWRDAADYIRNGVVFRALMLAIPLSFKLARALGVFFMFTGNLVPKLLTPLSAQQCDGARMQAWQRFTGWTWVLAGLAYAVVWLVLPSDVAEPVSARSSLAVCSSRWSGPSRRGGHVTRKRESRESKERAQLHGHRR